MLSVWSVSLDHWQVGLCGIIKWHGKLRAGICSLGILLVIMKELEPGEFSLLWHQTKTIQTSLTRMSASGAYQVPENSSFTIARYWTNVYMLLPCSQSFVVFFMFCTGLWDVLLLQNIRALYYNLKQKTYMVYSVYPSLQWTTSLCGLLCIKGWQDLPVVLGGYIICNCSVHRRLSPCLFI